MRMWCGWCNNVHNGNWSPGIPIRTDTDGREPGSLLTVLLKLALNGVIDHKCDHTAKTYSPATANASGNDTIPLESSTNDVHLHKTQLWEYSNPVLPFQTLDMFVHCTVLQFTQLYESAPCYRLWWIFAYNYR